MPVATSPFKLPPGYSSGMTLLRSIRMLQNPVEAIEGNMKKFGSTYSLVLPGNQLMIITQDAGFINHVLKENHTNYHRSKFTAERMAIFFGKGLLFANGDYWLRQRRLIQPGFHQKRLRDLYTIVLDTIRDCLKEVPQGESLDVYPVLHHVAFRVAIQSLFNIPLSGQMMADLTDTFNDVQDFVVKDLNSPLRKLFYPVTGSEKASLRKSDKLKNIFKDILDQRRKEGRSYGDLLDMLLEARYEDTGLPMEDDQLIDEMQVLVFAGHETTAVALSWLLYLLASSPAIIEEIKANIAVTDIYDSPRNDFFNAVINEGMRLYPPGWMNDRVALNDDAFGEFTFPKGTIINSFFYGMHRSPSYWEDALQFRPGRFLDPQGKLIRHKNFFPFGAGPRLCIGNNFALAEMCLFLHAFFSEFSIQATGIEPRMKPLITLRPERVMLGVRRNDHA